MTINQWIKEYIDDNNVDYPKYVDSVDSAIKLFMVDNIHKVETGESYVTINDWIKEYCDENGIELPFGIGDNVTALDFLRVCDLGGAVKSVENQSIASFDDGSGKDVEELVVGIEPVQSGSGDPSPSNVRPISGWDGVNVYRMGKNLISAGEPRTGTTNGITFSINDDGTVSASGTATAEAYAVGDNVYTVPVSGSFIYSGNPEGSSSNTYRTQIRWEVNGSWSSWAYINTPSSQSALNISKTTRIQVRFVVKSGVTVNNIVWKPMLRFSTVEDDTYEPYHGTTYTVPFGQTVYGGTLNVTTGELVVDRAMVDLGSIKWTLVSNRARAYISDIKIPHITSIPANALASQYVCVPANSSLESGQFAISNFSATSNIIFYYDSVNSPSGQLVYELASPQTIQLSATQVATLLGQNNIWADTGNIIKLDYIPKIFDTDGMDINEWIKKYCTEKNITLPSDMPDVRTTLNFLLLNGE